MNRFKNICKAAEDKVKKSSDEDSQYDIIEKTVNISRPVFTEQKLKSIYENIDYAGFEPISEIKKELHKNFGNGKESFKKIVYNRIPCVKWLKDYNFKEYLLADLLAGLVVGVTHVPQGK